MARPKQFDPEATLAVAMDQFRKKGFDATSLSDITACTGVRKASLYATYGAKRELFLSSLECYRRQAQADLAVALTGSKGVKETLRAIILSFVPSADGKPAERECLCVNSAVELGARDREIAERLSMHAHHIESQMAATIAAGQKRGEVNTEVDPKIAARIVQIALYGAIVAGRGCYSRRELVEVIDASLSILDVRDAGVRGRTARTRGARAATKVALAVPVKSSSRTSPRRTSAPGRPRKR